MGRLLLPRRAAAQIPVPPLPTPAAADSAAPARLQPPMAALSSISDLSTILDEEAFATREVHQYSVEIHKKFALSVACMTFVLIGVALALRFPRGGVGLVIGVSFLVFAIYYIGLIGGESLANHNIISPFWAMWADNVIFLFVGLLLVSRMGREGVTTRGGNFGETMDKISGWFTRTRGEATT